MGTKEKDLNLQSRKECNLEDYYNTDNIFPFYIYMLQTDF